MLADHLLIRLNTIIEGADKPYESSIKLILDTVKHKMDSIKGVEISGTLNNSNNRNMKSIKREIQSPKTSTDFLTERTRSVTSPLSTSPQSSHLYELPALNLTSNVIISQEKSGDISTRNYSDFMRSLAAKYNNNNGNDITKLPFFESSTSSNTKTFSQNCITESETQQNNTQNMSSNMSPLFSSLISNLQFSPNTFSHLIDMSSTQALVTLAHAAKEIEMHKILNYAQKRSSTALKSSPPIPRKMVSTSSNSLVTAQISPLSFMISAQEQPKSKHSKASTSLFETSNTTPLDLSSAQIKRSKLNYTASTCNSDSLLNKINDNKIDQQKQCFENNGLSTSSYCQALSSEISSWTVEDVCDFVGSINICAEYVQNFRDQCIDGSGLPLLTESHLTNSLGMKLGPALKLRSYLAKKMGGPCPCVTCLNKNAIKTASSSSFSNLSNINNKNIKSRPGSADSVS